VLHTDNTEKKTSRHKPFLNPRPYPYFTKNIEGFGRAEVGHSP